MRERTVDQETAHIRSATAGAATRATSRKSSPRDSKRSSQCWFEAEIQRRHPVDGHLLDLGFLSLHSCDLQAPGTWIEETLGSIKLTDWDLHVALGACLAGLAYLLYLISYWVDQYWVDPIFFYPYFQPVRDNLCDPADDETMARLGWTITYK